jgi:hypothetical protein
LGFSAFDWGAKPSFHLNCLERTSPRLLKANRRGEMPLLSSNVGSTLRKKRGFPNICWLEKPPSPCIFVVTVPSRNQRQLEQQNPSSIQHANCTSQHVVQLHKVKMPETSTAQSNDTNQSKKGMSINAMVRAAGFSSFNQFLLSYNLRIYNPDDVEEGKAILKALFQDKAK